MSPTNSNIASDRAITNPDPPHNKLPPLSPDDQKEWLVNHIPYRIRAVLPGIPMPEPWAVHLESVVQADQIALRSIGDSLWEGRLAAIRWLIMFAGISAVGDNFEPVRPKIHNRNTDVFITQIDGGHMKLFPNGDNAKFLARVWAGCSKATAHPTNGTAHPEIKERELATALETIATHLQNTIYARAEKSLIDFVLTAKTPQQLRAEW